MEIVNVIEILYIMSLVCEYNMTLYFENVLFWKGSLVLWQLKQCFLGKPPSPKNKREGSLISISSPLPELPRYF